MPQPTRAESLRSLFLALACALIVLIALYLAVHDSPVWADKDGTEESSVHGLYLQTESNSIAALDKDTDALRL